MYEITMSFMCGILTTIAFEIMTYMLLEYLGKIKN